MGFLARQIRLYVAKTTLFLEWWATELHQMFRPLLDHLETGRAAAQIELFDDRVEISTRYASNIPDRSLTINSSFFNLTDIQLEELRSITDASEIRIGLPDKEVCMLNLRHAGPRKPTQESVRYRLLQESPIDVERIAFTWRLHRGDSIEDTNTTRLHIALCRQTYLDQVWGTAKNYGLLPSTIGFMSPGSEELEFVFPIQRTRGVALSIKAHKNSILLASVLLMPIIAMLFVGAIATIDQRKNSHELDTRRSLLRDSEVLMRRQAGATAIHDTLKRMTTLPSIVNALNDLGRLVPENTWMTEVRLEGRSLHITGLSADPTSAAKAVVPSRLLSDIRLASVSSPTTGQAASQFEITATLVEKP